MRTVRTRYLADGKAYNDGREASLIEIEGPDDLVRLHDRIAEVGYYDRAYFDRHSYASGDIVWHFFFVAEMARSLRPRHVLEVGCGRGDVLWLLKRAGIDVAGIDISPEIATQARLIVRDAIQAGDFGEVLSSMPSDAPRYDLICGFDIWEHLLPARLGEYLAATLDASTDDGVFFFIVPAFGEDRVFGEQFPLEFEENRLFHERGEPYRFLIADADVPEVPALGHLTLAPASWWEATFRASGLVRMDTVERAFHHFLDAFLPHSIRSFFLLRRDTDAGRRRQAELEAGTYDLRAYTSTVARMLVRRHGPDWPFRFDAALRRKATLHWLKLVRLGLRSTVGAKRAL